MRRKIEKWFLLNRQRERNRLVARGPYATSAISVSDSVCKVYGELTSNWSTAGHLFRPFVRSFVSSFVSQSFRVKLSWQLVSRLNFVRCFPQAMQDSRAMPCIAGQACSRLCLARSSLAFHRTTVGAVVVAKRRGAARRLFHN